MYNMKKTKKYRQSKTKKHMKTKRNRQSKSKKQAKTTKRLLQLKCQLGGSHILHEKGTFGYFISKYDFDTKTFYSLINDMILLLQKIKMKNHNQKYNLDLNDNNIEVNDITNTPLDIRMEDKRKEQIYKPLFNIPFSLPLMTYLIIDDNLDDAFNKVFFQNTEFDYYINLVAEALIVNKQVTSRQEAIGKSKDLLLSYLNMINFNYKDDTTKFLWEWQHNVDIWGWIMLLRVILMRTNGPNKISSNVWKHSRKVIGKLIIYTITDGAIKLDIEKILKIINKIFEPSGLKRYVNKTAKKVEENVGRAVSRKFPIRIF